MRSRTKSLAEFTSGTSPPAVDPHNFTLRVLGVEIAFCVKGRRWAAKCRHHKHGRCFLTLSGKSCAGRPLCPMAHGLRNCSQSVQQEHVYAPPCDAGVSARLALTSELGGPALAALELPLENPPEVEPMCVLRVWHLGRPNFPTIERGWLVAASAQIRCGNESRNFLLGIFDPYGKIWNFVF